MVSETAGVVGSSGMWPTLTIPPGSTVHFQGTVQSSHQFAVKDSANVVLLWLAQALWLRRMGQEKTMPLRGLHRSLVGSIVITACRTVAVW